MRPYRGLTKDGKWVYGDRLTIYKKVYICNPSKVPVEIFYHDKPNGERVNILSSLCTAITEVIPETVGQQTGVKDDKGKEIYKGDCFRTSDKHGFSSNCYAEVVFEDGAFVIQLYRKDEMEIAPELILDFRRSFSDSFEIIADIHTTPELLEESK